MWHKYVNPAKQSKTNDCVRRRASTLSASELTMFWFYYNLSLETKIRDHTPDSDFPSVQPSHIPNIRQHSTNFYI